MAKCLSPSQGFIALARGTKRLQLSDPSTKCSTPRLTRTYATHAELPISRETVAVNNVLITATKDKSTSPFEKPVVTTLYSWPSMQPTQFAHYAYNHLGLTTRKDLLHKAVIYEMDNARQGSANTKHRTEVVGSRRKKVPQKGTGRARQSDLKSPSVRGGGVSHGPKPRDFGTDLNHKVYNLAHRVALSHRYLKGELFITSDILTMSDEQGPRFLANIFKDLEWGQGKGRSMVVVNKGESANGKESAVFKALKQVGEHAEVRDVDTVRVKDLLSCGRLLIEQPALKRLLAETKTS